MRNTTYNKVVNFFKVFSGFIIAVPLLIAGAVQAATMYSSGSLLQPNDITSSHIRNNTIVNADISQTTAFTLSSSTIQTLNVGTFVATSSTKLTATTTFGAIAYNFPQTDGTSGQFLKTGGAGNLSWFSGATAYFGGNGADGALATTSSATVINLGGLAVVTKNYTSISITGTGAISYTNPHANGTILVLKSQGACTLTSSAAPMLSMAGMGAQAGGAGAVCTNGSGCSYTTQTPGGAGASGNQFLQYKTNGAVAGGTDISSAGPGGVAATTLIWTTFPSTVLSKYSIAHVGAAGAGGGASSNANPSVTTGGTGGAGGGSIIMECAGALNFTTAGGISVAGNNGTNAVLNSGTGGNRQASGGGGGGAGFAKILYGSLVANSGTITVAGGTGGNTASNVASITGPGGGGSLTAGNNGVSAGPGSRSGGNGADGISEVAQNTEFN